MNVENSRFDPSRIRISPFPDAPGVDWEGLDWRDFYLGILGYSHYWYPSYGNWKSSNNYYIWRIKFLKEMGEPVHITEVGSTTLKMRGIWEEPDG